MELHIEDRAAMFTKAFIELALCFSDVLFCTFLHSIRYIKFLDLQLSEAVICRSSLVAEKVYLSWPCCRNGQVRQRGCLHLEMPDGGLRGIMQSLKVLLTSGYL